MGVNVMRDGPAEIRFRGSSSLPDIVTQGARCLAHGQTCGVLRIVRARVRELLESACREDPNWWGVIDLGKFYWSVARVVGWRATELSTCAIPTD